MNASKFLNKGEMDWDDSLHSNCCSRVHAKSRSSLKTRSRRRSRRVSKRHDLIRQHEQEKLDLERAEKEMQEREEMALMKELEDMETQRQQDHWERLEEERLWAWVDQIAPFDDFPF